MTVLDQMIERAHITVVRTAKAGRSIETGRGVTVFFDSVIDPTLLAEGLAREFVNRVQRMRKDAGLNVSDRIKVRYSAPVELEESLALERDYISAETLAVELTRTEAVPTDASLLTQTHEIDEWSVTVALDRA